ncbi:MAG: DUF2784 domain-containing protein [Gammaproteobacteria bacterium]|nr:DUF2784 domain-containing protein [Gammaproteobacteria bacterium]NNJ93213.1 DUF2784 family protein [Halobacteria archaeon]
MPDTQPQHRALRLLDVLFHIAHLAVILFSGLGWLVPALRPLHLGLQGMILFSWFGLGIFKGWTYCFLTDLHWRIRQVLGKPAHSGSYMKMLADKLSGRDVNAARVNQVTVSIFFITTLLSLLLLLLD